MTKTTESNMQDVTCVLKRALIIVDVQKDFLEGGALGVTGGTEAARRIQDYVADVGSQYDLIVASRDWHDAGNDNGGHFSDTPDYVDTWPPHCVAHTEGSAFADELIYRAPLEVLKGQGKPSYSAFEGTVFMEINHGHCKELLELPAVTLKGVLKERVQAVDVVGIATDYCVKATALHAVEAGLFTTVLAELTASVSPDVSATLDDLREAGVIVVGTPVPHDLNSATEEPFEGEEKR